MYTLWMHLARETSVAPQILAALARLRDVVRTASPPQLGLIYHVLMGMAGEALAAMLPGVGQREEPSQGPLFITVKQASSRYPVSRSFLYEHGAKEGIVTRPTGNHGKVVVNARALEQWLSQRRG